MAIGIQEEARQLLQQFKRSDYHFSSFESENWQQVTQRIILRHDVDFDCDVALSFAEMEAELNIQATYYFLINSGTYNLLSSHNIDIVNKIIDLGHYVSLHFDPVGFSDPVQQCRNELEVLRSVFGVKPKVISIHRPQKHFIREKISSFKVQHTYMAKFNEDHKYFSDSGGYFKYGHPLESDEFKQKMNLHLLLHPIWWADLSVDVMQKLDWLSLKKQHEMHCLMMENCIPYREYMAAKSAKAKPLSVNPQIQT